MSSRYHYFIEINHLPQIFASAALNQAWLSEIRVIYAQEDPLVDGKAIYYILKVILMDESSWMRHT
jgi:hypothetical protein